MKYYPYSQRIIGCFTYPATQLSHWGRISELPLYMYVYTSIYNASLYISHTHANLIHECTHLTEHTHPHMRAHT